jgi:acyl carrier protein
MLIPNERVADVVSRLTGVPVDQIRVSKESVEFASTAFDRLDTAELIIELEDEFDKETVQWALRYIAALSERAGSSRRANSGKACKPDCGNPLWDRDLDG